MNTIQEGVVMNMLKLAMRYVRWYHVVGLLLGVTAIVGVYWWLRERERTHGLEFGDQSDIVEAA